MKRKTHKMTRSDYDNYVAWSNTQHNERMQCVTERDNTPVHIAFAPQHVAHNETNNEDAQ